VVNESLKIISRIQYIIKIFIVKNKLLKIVKKDPKKVLESILTKEYLKTFER